MTEWVFRVLIVLAYPVLAHKYRELWAVYDEHSAPQPLDEAADEPPADGFKEARRPSAAAACRRVACAAVPPFLSSAAVVGAVLFCLLLDPEAFWSATTL